MNDFVGDVHVELRVSYGDDGQPVYSGGLYHRAHPEKVLAEVAEKIARLEGMLLGLQQWRTDATERGMRAI